MHSKTATQRRVGLVVGPNCCDQVAGKGDRSNRVHERTHRLMQTLWLAHKLTLIAAIADEPIFVGGRREEPRRDAEVAVGWTCLLRTRSRLQ